MGYKYHMDLRALRGRGARGRNKLGLKIGRAQIQKMTSEEIELLINRVRTATRCSIPSRSNKRNFRRIKRIILLMKNEGKPRLFFLRKSSLLSSFCEGREKLWLPFDKRKKETTVSLKGFSFLDTPKEAIESLKSIAISEALSKKGRIDFDDDICLDLGPYVVLGLMRQDMAGIFSGGRVTGPVADAIHAVNLRGLLKIGTLAKPGDIYTNAFPLRSRRTTGMSTNNNLATSQSAEGKACQDFVSTLDDWLRVLPKPMQMKSKGREHLAHLIGEVLDNATRHSDLTNQDGQWHIAGLMQGPFEDDEGAPLFACNLTVVSLGNTIYESLQTAPENIKTGILKYVQMHKSATLSEEALWNVAALQDNISRIAPTPENPVNGRGLMKALVAFFRLLFQTKNNELQSVMTVISGKSCIMIKKPYNDITGDEGSRILAFNQENTLENPPNSDYVTTLPIKFPGTLITIRFFLDNDHLVKLVKENGEH